MLAGNYIFKGGVAVAIYHLSIKVFSRGKGASSVAAAAYRAAEFIKNEYNGITSDYTHKGGVIHKEILLPEHAPAEYKVRAVLWNAVEMGERYKTAQLAREIEISLPVELSREQNIALARRFVNEIFVRAGMCADVCVHDNNDGNPHAHIMLTMRPIEQDGKWGQKSRSVNGQKVPTVDWNEQTKAEDWRKAWAAYCNSALRIHGYEERIDHRSYERQGVDQIPTVHLGASAHQMEKRGIRTRRGDINREIQVTNKELRQLKARIVKLQSWLKEETTNNEPPTLADVIESIFDRKAKEGKSSTSQSIYNIKDVASMLNFLTRNKVMDMAGHDKCFGDMIGKQQGIRDNLKRIDRRMNTLEEHLKQSGIYKAHRKHKTQYQKLYAQFETLKKAGGLLSGRKIQRALDTANEYHETYSSQIAMYDKAEQYLKGVLQEHFDPKKQPPIKKWQTELTKLTTERKLIDSDFYKLRDEVKEAERIRSRVYSIMRQEHQQRRTHDMEI
jgi:hypothetical protein